MTVNGSWIGKNKGYAWLRSSRGHSWLRRARSACYYRTRGLLITEQLLLKTKPKVNYLPKTLVNLNHGRPSWAVGSTDRRNTLSLTQKMECRECCIEVEYITTLNRRRRCGTAGKKGNLSMRLVECLIDLLRRFLISCLRAVVFVPLQEGAPR